MSSPKVALCFILTKWYVKGKFKEWLDNIISSFILTKWYVKWVEH
ncbi:hypothetical protein QEW_1819 [Clostridioides difficile CD160]|nr:hypothetical protein QEW_1819 [Clostridioides difficile CD160]